METLVYQSYRANDVPGWMARCMASVRDWAGAQGFDYRFIGDEIFDLAPDWFRAKADGRRAMVTDLARLILARQYLDEGYARTIWFDADVLVFDAGNFSVPTETEYAFGWQIWIYASPEGKPVALHQVHDAVCVFCRGNSMLEFYIHACLERMRKLKPEEDPAKFAVSLGPGFLSSLHDLIGLKLLRDVALFSPLMLRDIAAGGGAAIDIHRRLAPAPVRAANLTASAEGMTSYLLGAHEQTVTLTPDTLEAACAKLLETRGAVVNEA